MPLPRDCPADKVLVGLDKLIADAEFGSVVLDKEIAEAFAPNRKLLVRDGELYWCARSEDGLSLSAVPCYTTSIEACLPQEQCDRIEVFYAPEQRWRAVRDGVAEVEAATEALARRRLAIRLMKTKWRSRKKMPPISKAIEDDGPAPPHVDYRDMVIAALARQVDRLSSSEKYEVAEVPDREFFDGRTPRSPESAPRAPQHLESNAPTISQALEMWIAEQNPSTAAGENMRRSVQRFVTVNGDLNLPSIRKIHVRELLIRMRDIPRSRTKEFKSAPLDVLVEYGRSHPEIPKISISTINTQHTYLRILFNWAFHRDYIDFNPAAGLHVRDRRPQAEKRLPYNINDLKLIFEASSLYTGHSAAIRTRPGEHVYRDGKFWLPLLGLFTGARTSELVNLYPTDLKSENETLYLDITKGANITRTKSLGSERKIPVHPELVRIGIVDYFESKAIEGQRYVFHDLGKNSATGNEPKSWHEKWRRIQRQAGCEHPKKTFHSFRHTFKDACRAARMHEEVHDALTGHITAAMGRAYGRGVPLNILAEQMLNLSYPGLDLSHLYVDSRDQVSS